MGGGNAVVRRDAVIREIAASGDIGAGKGRSAVKAAAVQACAQPQQLPAHECVSPSQQESEDRSAVSAIPPVLGCAQPCSACTCTADAAHAGDATATCGSSNENVTATRKAASLMPKLYHRDRARNNRARTSLSYAGISRPAR